MASPKPARVDWSGLPSAVLDVVSRRIIANAEYVRFRAVCTSWRSATLARPRHLPCQLPWLALPSTEASEIRRFFSLPDRKIHIIRMPVSGGSHCCGSSFGWFAFLDTPINFLLHYMHRGLEDAPSLFAGVLRRSRADDLLGMTPYTSYRSDQLGYTSELNMAIEFFLLNPLTQERIQLPTLNIREVLQNLALEPGDGYVFRGCPGPDFSCDLEYIRRHIVSRFVLSSDPTSGDCVAMASFCHGATFAFCRPGGNSSWTTLTTSPFSSFQDMVFYRERFYAVDSRLVLYVCDVGPPARIQEFPYSGGDRAACPMEGCLVPGRRSRGQVVERVYLVESRGDLLMVLKTYDEGVTRDEEDQHHAVLDFEVYKLDLGEEPQPTRWVELESLGDQVLFLGPGHSLSLPAGDFVGGCPGNCIYFSDYRPGRRAAAVHGGPDFGVFHLGDGHVERVPCCPVDPGSVWQPSLWISPSLKSTTTCWE